ncbi:MAG: NAD-dependent epimerase/dehydratase family protein [Thiothrix sp.]|nr:NAD-dependent epimerase/dehydratase family protein [Thiothrix sp.]HPQ95309.1 NAD-dependent epimerase/dehydratase family protein [Thiolinea sp.]
MNILLTGASGFIGQHLSTALTVQGHTVVPCSRRHGHDFAHMTRVEDWHPLLTGVDAAINAVGIIAETGSQRFEAVHHQAPCALFHACAQQSVQQVVQISALGADEQAATPYHLSKRAADDCLRTLPLNGFVLRPSLVYGQGGSSMALFRRLARLPVIGVPGDGHYRLRPVHVSDVVACVLQCLQPETPTQPGLDLVGREEVSYREWLQRLRQFGTQRRPALIIPMPLALLLPMASLGQHLIPMLSPDNLRMLTRGNTADSAPMERFLGRKALDIQTGLARS